MADKNSRGEVIQGLVSFNENAAESQEQKVQDGLVKKLQNKFEEFIESKVARKDTTKKLGKLLELINTTNELDLELIKLTNDLDDYHKQVLGSNAVTTLEAVNKSGTNDVSQKSQKLCSMTILKTLVDCEPEFKFKNSDIFQKELLEELKSANEGNVSSTFSYLSEDNKKVAMSMRGKPGLLCIKAAMNDNVKLTKKQQKRIEGGCVSKTMEYVGSMFRKIKNKI